MTPPLPALLLKTTGRAIRDEAVFYEPACLSKQASTQASKATSGWKEVGRLLRRSLLTPLLLAGRGAKKMVRQALRFTLRSALHGEIVLLSSMRLPRCAATMRSAAGSALSCALGLAALLGPASGFLPGGERVQCATRPAYDATRISATSLDTSTTSDEYEVKRRDSCK